MRHGHSLVKRFRYNFNFKYRILSSEKKKMFKFSDYDCIGFDLDSTILQYNIKNIVELEYDLITNYLVQNKGYNPKAFGTTLTKSDWDFMQNGLFFDFEQGNILKLNSKGKVHIVTHGTKFLSSQEIDKYYPDREWALSTAFVEDPLVVRNGPLSLKIRTLLTCFDMPVSVIFAKAVDTLDAENGKPLEKYKILADILEAVLDMYTREQLKNNAGNFYSELKRNPERYIKKCDPNVLAWIQNIKKEKKTFLVTGSNSDFIELTTSYAFNQDLKSLFDVIVCYAKKPAFFTENRPFYSLKDYYEDKIITSEEFEVGGIYNQGNFKELKKFLSRISGVSNPKCLYIGDNLIEDVYAPKNSETCDTLAIVAEQMSEGMAIYDTSGSDKDILNSKAWGPYFVLENKIGFESSYWGDMIKKHSKICVPSLSMIVKNPLDKPLKCFNPEDDQDFSGYYPDIPITIHNLK